MNEAMEIVPGAVATGSWPAIPTVALVGDPVAIAPGTDPYSTPRCITPTRQISELQIEKARLSGLHIFS
jgi:hypothetical protein